MGGGPDTAFKWNIGYGGMVLESAYPYTSGTTKKGGACNDAGMEKVAHFSSFNYLPAKDEEKLLAALQNEGPISITVNANPWQSYTGGILTTSPSTSLIMRSSSLATPKARRAIGPSATAGARTGVKMATSAWPMATTCATSSLACRPSSSRPIPRRRSEATQTCALLLISINT